MKKKAKGPPAWFELFDTGEMDTVCELVRRDVTDAAQGHPSTLHLPLRGILLERLSQYMADHYRASPDARSQALNAGALTGATQTESYRAAERLSVVVERLADDFEDRYPFDVAAADIRAVALRFAWLEFIAYGAAYLVYWKRPKEWKQSAAASRGPRGRAKGLTAEEFAKLLLKEGRTALTTDIAQRIAEAYGITDRTVYDRQKEARKKGLLKLAADTFSDTKD